MTTKSPQYSPGSDPDRVNRRLVRALLILAVALAVGAACWMIAAVFDRVHNTMVNIIFGVLFGYVVYPPIRWLANRRVPVPVAGLIVYAALIVATLAAAAWLAPAIATQAADLSQNLPKLVADVQHQIADPVHAPLLERFPMSVRSTIATNTGKAAAVAGGLAAVISSHALQILSGTTSAIIDVVLVMGLTLLIVGDLTHIQRFGIRLVPSAHRAPTLAFMNDVDAVIGGFVRGQVLLAFAVAVAGTIVLIAVGVPYAILLGLLAGVISIVPIVGAIFAALPVVIIAFITVGVIKAIVVTALFAVILGVQQNVLVPLVVSRSVGVTPLVVFVALLFGSEAFGILGALLAIPVAGILRVASERLFPDDPNADAVLERARVRAGEPPAIVTPPPPA